MSREEKKFHDDYHRGWDNLYVGTEMANNIRRERRPERIIEMVEFQRDPFRHAKLHNARRAAIENPNTPTMYLLDIYISSERNLNTLDPVNTPLGPGGRQPITWKMYMPGNVAAEALAALVKRDWRLTTWEEQGTKPEALDLARKRLESEKRLALLRNDAPKTPYNKQLGQTLRNE